MAKRKVFKTRRPDPSEINVVITKKNGKVVKVVKGEAAKQFVRTVQQSQRFQPPEKQTFPTQPGKETGATLPDFPATKETPGAVKLPSGRFGVQAVTRRAAQQKILAAQQKAQEAEQRISRIRTIQSQDKELMRAQQQQITGEKKEFIPGVSLVQKQSVQFETPPPVRGVGEPAAVFAQRVSEFVKTIRGIRKARAEQREISQLPPFELAQRGLFRTSTGEIRSRKEEGITQESLASGFDVGAQVAREFLEPIEKVTLKPLPFIAIDVVTSQFPKETERAVKGLEITAEQFFEAGSLVGRTVGLEFITGETPVTKFLGGVTGAPPAILAGAPVLAFKASKSPLVFPAEFLSGIGKEVILEPEQTAGSFFGLELASGIVGRGLSTKFKSPAGKAAKILRKQQPPVRDVSLSIVKGVSKKAAKVISDVLKKEEFIEFGSLSKARQLKPGKLIPGDIDIAIVGRPSALAKKLAKELGKGYIAKDTSVINVATGRKLLDIKTIKALRDFPKSQPTVKTPSGVRTTRLSEEVFRGVASVEEILLGKKGVKQSRFAKDLDRLVTSESRLLEVRKIAQPKKIVLPELFKRGTIQAEQFLLEAIKELAPELKDLKKGGAVSIPKAKVTLAETKLLLKKQKVPGLAESLVPVIKPGTTPLELVDVSLSKASLMFKDLTKTRFSFRGVGKRIKTKFGRQDIITGKDVSFLPSSELPSILPSALITASSLIPTPRTLDLLPPSDLGKPSKVGKTTTRLPAAFSELPKPSDIIIEPSLPSLIRHKRKGRGISVFKATSDLKMPPSLLKTPPIEPPSIIDEPSTKLKPPARKKAPPSRIPPSLPSKILMDITTFLPPPTMTSLPPIPPSRLPILDKSRLPILDVPNFLPPRRPPLIFPRRKKRGELVFGFKTFVRRRGKFEQVGSVLPELEAFALGKKEVFESPARTFFVEKTRIPVMRKGRGLISVEGLRRPRGKTELPKTAFVEISKLAIKEAGELSGITARGIAASRAGKGRKKKRVMRKKLVAKKRPRRKARRRSAVFGLPRLRLF